MAISYPLSLPTNIGIANITLTAENAVAISQSPFTYAQQVVKHQGERWSASVSLPPMLRSDAEPWVAFLLSLKGQYGTFLLGDPNCKQPQGSALSSRKNLLSYTELFSNSAWNKVSSTVTSGQTDPLGGNTAFTLTATGADGAINQSYTQLAATDYTFSIWVRRVSGTGTVQIRTSNDPLSFGTISVTSEWQRFSRTTTSNLAGAVNVALRVRTSGDVIQVWGAQLELGTTATSYQPIADAYGPFVNGAGQTGGELLIDGASPNQTSYLKAGDYIQLGTLSSATFHKVLANVVTNDLGQATIDIWPSLRSSPADGANVIINNTTGRFRLKDNIQQWQINDISSYGITFDCVEAL